MHSLKEQSRSPDSKGAINLAARRETAKYISELTLELRNLAKAHDMLSLQGLLEVAYYEAFTVSTQVELPEGELERIKEMSNAATG